MNIANPKQIGNPGKSPALRYELMLKEEGAKPGSKGTITPERIHLCFEIFDELLPQLGVFQRVLRMIRDELFTAVYSSDFTAGRHDNSSGNKRSSLQHIPHCLITKRHLDQHNEKVQQLKAANDSLREELSSCKDDLAKCRAAVEAYQEKIADKQSEISIVSKSLQQKTTENDKLKKSLSQQQRIQERIKQEAGFRMSSLQSSLNDISMQAAELKKYKDTFDGLSDAFSKRKDRSNEKRSVATERNHLRHSLHLAKVLHNQLLEIQNKSINEYEQYMNSHINELSDVNNLDAHLKVIEYQAEFRRSMGEIIEEIALTQAHMDKQQKRLNQLNALHSSGVGLQSAVSDPTHPANPLVPQEQVLNKYAAMVSTSTNNGKSFYPHREAIFCQSCGEKTVICPHRSFEKELILTLPLHSTHIMLSRPYCREPPKSKAPPTSSINVAVSESDRQKSVSESDRQKSVSEFGKPKPKPFSLDPEFSNVWRNYRQEFPDVVRHIPRQLSLEDTLAMIEQLYGNLLLDDDINVTDDAQSLMEFLYSFMQDRYIITEVMQLATCDFLSAIEEHCEVNKAILLFGSVLCGRVDGSCFRYYLIMATYVSKVPLETSKDYHQFASIVYPFLQEDDVDQLTMDYVAYNENKCSQQSVLDYIIYLILREKEPQMVEISSQLLEFNTYHPGTFTLLEFIEASDKMVSISSDQLRHHLYQQSLASEGEGKTSLPVNKIAQIIAYLLIQQHHQGVMAKLEQSQLGRDDIVRPSSSFTTFYNVKSMASRLKNSKAQKRRSSSITVF